MLVTFPNYVQISDKFLHDDFEYLNKMIKDYDIIDPLHINSTMCINCEFRSPMELNRCNYCNNYIYYSVIYCIECNKQLLMYGYNVDNLFYIKIHKCIKFVKYSKIFMDLDSDYNLIITKIINSMPSYFKTQYASNILKNIKRYLYLYKKYNTDRYYIKCKKNMDKLLWTKTKYIIFSLFIPDFF